jgi:hypothetical protein
VEVRKLVLHELGPMLRQLPSTVPPSSLPLYLFPVEKNPELLQALESAYSQVCNIPRIFSLTRVTQEHLRPDTSLLYWVGLHHLSQWAFSPVSEVLLCCVS